MKKRDIIAEANKEHNPIWALVHILEKLGKITNKGFMSIRKPAVPISETQDLVNHSENEKIIVERKEAYGPITNFRLLKYDLRTNEVEGGYSRR